MGLTDSSFFVSALVICVESGVMSTVSKLVQFAIPISDRALSVVPLVTIASNLIILRKALGSDIVRSMTTTHANGQLSEIRFGSRVMPNATEASGGVATIDSFRRPVSVSIRGRMRSNSRRGSIGETVEGKPTPGDADSVIDGNAHENESKRVFDSAV